jgi:ribonuclease P protein component
VKRINSLKGKKHFEELNFRGRKINRKGIQLIYLKQSGNSKSINTENNAVLPLSPEFKIGIPVGRKFGNSVIRNKAKRRIRAICRELLPEVYESYYIIIRPREEFKNLSYADSREIIRVLLKDAGVLRS